MLIAEANLNRKIVPIKKEVLLKPNMIGHFEYCRKKDLSTVDQINQAIMGLPSLTPNFKQVYNCIDPSYQQQFFENTTGNKSNNPLIVLEPILLKNKNLVQDTVQRTFDKDGFIIHIRGFTRLIKLAA